MQTPPSLIFLTGNTSQMVFALLCNLQGYLEGDVGLLALGVVCLNR